MLLLVLQIACSSGEQTCIPVQSHDGAGQVLLSNGSNELVLALETGAGNVKVFQEGAPWWPGHWSGRVENYNLWGTSEKRIALLQRKSLQAGSNSIRVWAWREQHAPIHSIESAWGGQVDGWAGLDFFFALGDLVWFDGKQVCGRRRGACKIPLDERPGVPVLVDGKKHLFLADSALRWSRLWGYGSTPSLATTEDGTSFLAWPFADEMGKDRHGTGKLGSKSFDGALGWEVLSESKWTWDLCTAEFQITEGPSVPKDPGLTPLQLHRYNGHGRRTPYSHPSIQ